MKNNLSLTLVLTLTSCLSAIGQTAVYSGEAGGDWSIDTNWSAGAKPTSADNASVRTPGPVVSTAGEVANNLYMAGGAEPTTVTITTGGSLTISQDVRVGLGGAGTAELVINGGTLTSNRDIYVSQTDNGGSQFTVNSGTVTIASTIRVGFQAQGHLMMAGGTLSVGNNFFIAQNAGSVGSTVSLGGGEISTVGGIFLGYAEDSSMHILSADVTINIGGPFEFGRDGLATLEYVLTAEGVTSPINCASMTLGAEASRILKIDGNSVSDPGSITSITLFHSTGDPFTEEQLGTLNANLELVGLSGLSLQLANGDADIVLAPESSDPTWAGYPLDPDNLVDTGAYFGWLYVEKEPWLYSYSLGDWIYGDEAGFASGAAWIYIPK